MKRLTNQQVKELATLALERGNPYIKLALKYNVGYTPMYKYAGQHMTREEIDKAYLETAEKDIRRGYEERGSGLYDKWYRYTRADEGRAYDMGVRLAADTEGCAHEMTIIPCIH